MKSFFWSSSSLFSLLLLSACMSAPKTTAEFRKLSKERGGVQTYTVNAPLETVVSRINQHAEKCVSWGSTWRRTDGLTGSRSDTTQFVRWEKLGKDKPSMTIFLDNKQTLNQPKGGLALHTLDFERKGDQTLVTSYGWNVNSWSMYDFTEDLKHAAKGEKGDCQFEKNKK